MMAATDAASNSIVTTTDAPATAFPGVLGDGDAVGAERLRLVRAAVPRDDVQARPREAARHARAHDPGAEHRHLRHGVHQIRTRCSGAV